MRWRATWLGRILRLHSPSAELLGKCWCQRASLDDINRGITWWGKSTGEFWRFLR